MQVGEVVPMSDDEGQEIVGVVVDVEAEFVHVDFNHPWPGWTSILRGCRRHFGVNALLE